MVVIKIYKKLDAHPGSIPRSVPHLELLSKIVEQIEQDRIPIGFGIN